MKITIRLIAAAICLLVVATGCEPGRWRTWHGMACGTACNVTYRSSIDLSDSITATLSRVENALTVFNPTSPVSAINRGEDITADDIIVEVFNISQDAARMSGGAFDPTVGPLVELWGFGAAGPTGNPADACVDSALASVGILDCSLSADRHIIRKTSDTTFNFGAVGKGYAARAVMQMLGRNGVSDCMAEVGGDLALTGHNPHSEAWQISIDTPEGDSHNGIATIGITDCGIATSGNYRNYRDLPRGERVGHTISPETGRPVQTDVLSATVIARDAATADALATACMVLGSSRSVAMAEELDGVELLLITASTDSASQGGWRIITTPGFPSARSLTSTDSSQTNQ